MMKSLLVTCLSLLLFPIIIQSTQEPHILFMIIDDLGWTDISWHGAEYSTPTIDNLIKNGVELTNYYVQLTCTPTRSAIITGKYPFKTGLQCTYVIPPGSTEHIPFNMPTMAELLQNIGYTTYGFGKWHLGYSAWNMTPIGRGFHSYFGFFQGGQTYYNHFLRDPSYPISNGYDFWKNDNVYIDAIGTYSTQLYNEEMNNILINYNKSSPLFVYGAFQTIHSPIINELPPIQYNECNNIINEGRKIYCNKMKYLDNTINEMIKLYIHYGLWNNTILVITTDNGGMPNFMQLPSNESGLDRAGYGCNYPYRGGKGTLFQGGIKGIGFLSGPLIEKRGLNGTKSNILSHAMDWLATFIEGIANKQLPKNKEFDSLNIWNSIDNNNKNEWNRTTLYVDIEVNLNMSCIINDDWKYIIYGNSSPRIYDNWWFCNQTYIGNESLSIIEYLFNITDDPFEHNNLIHKYPDIAIKLNNMIQNQINNGQYYPEQDRRIHPEAMPELHHDVWAPWL